MENPTQAFYPLTPHSKMVQDACALFLKPMGDETPPIISVRGISSLGKEMPRGYTATLQLMHIETVQGREVASRKG